jgi:glutamate/tyrosine decarboxylase-like PLP-dependent enzyme
MSTDDVSTIASLFDSACLADTRNQLVGLVRRILYPKDAFSGSLEISDLAIDSASQTPLSELLQDVDAHIVANSVHYRHKWAMAHMVPPTAIAGVVGDLLIGALNQCAFIWEEAPVAATLEGAVLRWMAEKLKLSRDAEGLLTTGGTMSNYLAALFAKQSVGASQTIPPGDLCVIASDQAHFSVQKALRLLGLPDSSLLRVSTGVDGRLKAGSIAKAAETLASEGKRPFLFICTAGTPNGGVIESAEDFLLVAEQYDAWCHIDAAYGGAVCLTRSHDSLASSWANADSISWDPHKSMFVPYSVGTLFVKNARSFDILRVTSEYALKPELAAFSDDVGSAHFYTSRRLEALKLWMTIRHFGDVGFEAATSHCFALATAFAALLKETSCLQLHTPPDTSIVCFRCFFAGLTDDELNLLNSTIQSRLFVDGGPLLSTTRFNGLTYLRAVLMNPLLQVEDLGGAIEAILAAARSAVESLNGPFHHECPSRY